jgi:hypothetical protein
MPFGGIPLNGAAHIIRDTVIVPESSSRDVQVADRNWPRIGR